MKHVMTWALPCNIDDHAWADFCRLASTVASCPAVPLLSAAGRPMAARDVFGGQLDFQPVGLPDLIEMRSADISVPLIIERGKCGSICTRADIGHLAYGMLLAARYAIPNVGLHAMISERDAGFGMALARDAIRGWSGPEVIDGRIDEAFAGMPGVHELSSMDERAKRFAQLRAKVHALLDAVGPGVPAGEFERVTLATAHAVLTRLALGVDSQFDAEYSVFSLEGYFRQSVFVLPQPERSEPLSMDSGLELPPDHDLLRA